MVMILNKRVFRMIKENKGRYFGIFVLILMGSFTFTAMTGIGDNLARLVSGFAAEHRQEQLHFSVNVPITDIAGLEAATGTMIERQSHYDLAFGEGVLRLLTQTERVNVPAIITGGGLTNPRDILVDPVFLQTHNLSIGDSIDVYGNAFTVTGTFSVPNYIYILQNVHDVMPPVGFGIGLVLEEAVDGLAGAVQTYSVYFPHRNSENTEENTLNQRMIDFNRRLRDMGYVPVSWVDAGINNRIQMAWASTTGMQTMSTPMSVVIFLLCSLIVSIVVWRTAKADGVIIGTLYAQGYRRGEVTRHYMTLPVMLSAIAGIAGTLLALPAAAPAVLAMTEFYNLPVDRITVSPFTPVMGVLLPVALIGLICFFVIQRVLKRPAAELMKGGVRETKANVLERAVTRLGLEKFKFATKFKVREQVRSIPRLLFLLLGANAAAVLMLFGLTINNSMNIVMTGADEMYNFAVEYAFRELQQGGVPEGAEPFNAMRVFPVGRENAEFYVTGIVPDSQGVVLRDSQGALLPLNQVNITSPLAGRLRLGAGDTITFINRTDGAEYSLIINGIADTMAQQFIFMPLEDFNYMAGLPLDGFSGLFSQHELNIDPSLLSGIKDLTALDDAMAGIAAPMTMMIVGMTVVSVLVGAIMLFLVTSLMVEESRHTISLMKIFGYRRKEVARLILNSGVAVVITGFVLAVPAVLISGNALYGYLGEMINLILPMLINPVHVIITFIVMYAVYKLTKMFCGRKIAQISMTEALKAGSE